VPCDPFPTAHFVEPGLNELSVDRLQKRKPLLEPCRHFGAHCPFDRVRTVERLGNGFTVRDVAWPVDRHFSAVVAHVGLDPIDGALDLILYDSPQPRGDAVAMTGLEGR
jgi:hypothetical protein